MTDRVVPVIESEDLLLGVSTGEVVGTAKVSPPDENGKCYASISRKTSFENITEPKIVEQHKGLVELLLEKETRTHDAFLNGYSEDDEGLYE